MTGFLIPGVTAPGTGPSGADYYPGEFVVSDLPDLPDEWLCELGTAPAPMSVQPPALATPGAWAMGAAPDSAASVAAPDGTVLRLSLRGWIGEPSDDQMANVLYAKRLVEPPTLVRSIRVLPEDSARLSFQSGELSLDNADGGLDVLGGDWTMAGRPAVLRRGPHRTPIRARYGEFGRVADLRITSAALTSGDRLTLGLREAATDLSVPACQTYTGTGGLEGDASLKGQLRPLLLGIKRQIQLLLLLSSPLVWQVAAGPLLQVFGVRDQGADLTPAGDYPSLAALLGATVPPGSYATCLALGLVRTGRKPFGMLTADAQAAGDGSHGGIALALLRGPGGLPEDRIVASGFASLPGGLAGWIWTGGTVAAALDEVLRSCGGWWGSDRLGRIVAGRLVRPDLMAPRFTLERWMLTAEPSEERGAVPRYRQRVAYRRLATVQSATDLVGLDADKAALVAAYGTDQQVATAYSAATYDAYPSATDPDPLPSGYDAEADAQILADELLALHGVRRRRWRVPVGKWGHLIDLGDVVAVDHPRLSGKSWVAIASDEVGDAKTLTLWG
jgi:hypothetical protein